MTVAVTVRSGSASASVTPMVRQGVIWLPVRAVVEGLAGKVEWDQATESIVLTLGSDWLQVQVDQQRALSNSSPIALLGAPEMHDGTTYMTWFDFDTYLPIDSELVVSSTAETQPQPLAGISLCLDPGHGGDDPGSSGPTGLLEKDVNLAVALRLAELLRHAGAQVVLTREGDQSRSLSERSQLANDRQVNWFISVHCNSFSDPAAHGTETYYYPGDVSGGRLAASVHAELIKALGRYDRGVKTETFHVIRETTMPAILVELAFISNPDEERLLSDPQFQARAAQAIYQGLVNVVAPRK